MNKRILGRFVQLIILFMFALSVYIKAQIPSLEMVEQVAHNWVYSIVNYKGHWAGSRTPEILSIKEIKTADKEVGFLCQIKPMGFVIVAQDMELSPIKAYSTTCNLYDQSENGMMDLIKATMERSLKNIAKFKNLESTISNWQSLMNGQLTHFSEGKTLISSNWHQRPPYNHQCPSMGCDWSAYQNFNSSALVGCVPIAGAQIARYWCWPPYGEAWINGDPYDWKNMPDQITIHSPIKQVDAVAELCVEFGVVLDASYGCSRTGAHFSLPVSGYGYVELEDVFKDYFRYNKAGMDYESRDNFSAQEWFNIIKEEINNNRPIGYGIPDHAIVVDGWREVNTDGKTRLEYHINYGWGGTNTAWFILDNIPGGDYDEEQMLFHIWPTNRFSTAIAGYISCNHSFPYRYFDRNTVGVNATIAAGHKLQFLPGINVSASPGAGIYLKIEGSSSNRTVLFANGNESIGAIIKSGAIKLSNDGGMVLTPQRAPSFLRSPNSTGGRIDLTWESENIENLIFEIERKGEFDLDYKVISTSDFNYFSDPDVSPGGTYYYRVKAIHKNGQTSGYSSEVLISPTDS
ncbi:C10 family peptidase [candidate division KSB1 bacterium]|nr:C10 family peptidase [candidate division KSB1 bacterium]